MPDTATMRLDGHYNRNINAQIGKEAAKWTSVSTAAVFWPPTSLRS